MVTNPIYFFTIINPEKKKKRKRGREGRRGEKERERDETEVGGRGGVMHNLKKIIIIYSIHTDITCMCGLSFLYTRQ